MNQADMIAMVKAIKSPYKSLYDMCMEGGLRLNLEDLTYFDVKHFVPKVIDDDAIGVYEHTDNGNLYFIDEYSVTKVVPTHILTADDNYTEMDEHELLGKYDCIFSGESDDFKFYVYFEEV